MVQVPGEGPVIGGGSGQIGNMTRAIREPEYEYWLGGQRVNTLKFKKGKRYTDSGPVDDAGWWSTAVSVIRIGDDKGCAFLFNRLNASVFVAFYPLSVENINEPISTQTVGMGPIEIPKGASRIVMSCSQSESCFAAELEKRGIVPGKAEVDDVCEADWIYGMYRAAPFCRNLAKKYTKESGWFFMRQSLSGTLSFHGKDFDKVWTAPHDADFIFLVRHWRYKGDDLTMEEDRWEDYFTGTFAKTGCTFDYGKRKCVPKIEALDAYTGLLARWEDEVDLVKLGTPRTTIKDMALRPVVQTYVAGSKTVCNFYGAAYQDTEADEAVDIDYGKLGFNANSSDQPLVKKYGFRCADVYDEFVINGFTEIADVGMNGRYVRVADSNYSNVSLQPSGNTDTASDRIGYRRWVNENGYACRVGLVVAQTNNSVTVTMQIFASLEGSNTDGATVLAVSQNLNCEGYPGAHVLLLGLWGLDRFFPTQAGDNPHRFHSLSTGANSAVSECFSQYIYQRVLSVKDKYASTNGVKLAEDDPFYEGNYKYAIPYPIGAFCMSAEKSQEATPFGIDDNNKYFVMPEGITGYSNAQSLRPLCKDSWGMASLWWSATAYKTAYIGGTRPSGINTTAVVFDGLTETYDHRDAFSIADALAKALEGIGCGVRHKAQLDYSRFLYGAMPVPGTDRFYVFITQRTNVLKGNYDMAAQKCPVTLKGLLEMLRDMFNCYWFVSERKLFIEHISYFLNGGSYTAPSDTNFRGLDFTELRDRFNNMPTAYFQTQLSFDREGSQVPREYALNFGEEGSYVFDNVRILLTGKNVDISKKEEVTVTDVCADVDLMHARPGDFSEEGLALLCPVKVSGAYTMQRTGVTGLRDEYGNGFSPTVQNWYASLIHSALKLYPYNLPAAGYRIDKVMQSSFGTPDGYVRKIASQTLRFPMGDDPAENGRVRTEIGTGEIEGMSVDLDSRTVEATVAYDPTKITNV